MRNPKFLFFFAALAAMLVLSACQAQQTPQPTQEVHAPAGVLAQGQVEPAEYIDVAFTVPGRVETVAVNEGETVQAGQVLARLSGGEARAADLARAQQELLAAQKALQDLQANPGLVEVQARAAIADAETVLKAARDSLAKLKEGIDPFLVAQAETRLTLAQAQFEQARKDAQAQEDQANPDPLKLAQAQSKRADAEKAVKDAQESLDDLKQGIDPLLIAQAEAHLRLAEAQYEKVRQDVQMLQNGVDPQLLQIAQARLESAQAGVASAQAGLIALELHSPMAGVVTGLSLKVGQFMPAGQPALAVADFSKWIIKTDDLTELEVMAVKPDQAVTVLLDALPTERLTGTVTHIAQRFEDRRGDVTYTVTIQLDIVQAGVRWGMTGQVNFAQDK